MFISKGFKALGTAIVPILIFSQTAMAAPSLITYQAGSQNVSVQYLNALSDSGMKSALIAALSKNETANTPIYVSDDGGKIINYSAAINKSENYATALTDSAVQVAAAPVATSTMGAGGVITAVTPVTTVTVSTVAAVPVTTVAGTAPVLPATVTATMSDGTTTTPAVTWTTPTASQYAAAGTFAVTGTIAGTAVTATANVTVTAASAAPGLTVSTVMASTQSIATNQTLVTIGTVTLTAGSQDATVSGISLNRSGLSSDSAVSNLTVWNGATRLNIPALFSNSVSNTSFTSALTIPAGTTITLKITADFSAATGNQFIFSLNNASSIKTTATVTGTFPATSGAFTAASVSLGSLNVALAPDSPAAGKVSPGATNIALAKYNLSASGENLSLQQITLTNDGSAGDTDMSNLQLFNGTTQVGATATSTTNRQVTFTFPQGLTITNGTTMGLTLKGNVGTGIAGRTMQFDIDTLSDVQAIGATYGTTIEPGSLPTNANILNGSTGSLVVSLDSTNPATGNIAAGQKSVNFEALKVQANGEPVQLQKIYLTLTPTAPGYTGEITNLKIMAGGVVLASEATPFSHISGDNTAETILVPLTNPLTIQPGTSSVISVQADVAPSITGAFTFALANSTTAIVATGTSTGKDASYSSGSALPGNTQTISAMGITPTWTAFSGTDNAFANEVGHVAGTLTLATNTSESDTVNQISVDATTVANIRNMRIVDSNGNVLTNTITAPIASPNVLVFTSPLSVAKSSPVTIKVLVDITPTAAGSSAVSLTGSGAGVTAYGATTGASIAELAPVGTAQTVNIGSAVVSGQVTIAASSIANLGTTSTVQSGATSVKFAAVTVTNASSEAVTFKKIRLVGTFSSGNNADLSNVRVVDGSGNVLGTVANLVAGSGATNISLTTPLNIAAGKNAELAVLGDVTSSATAITQTIVVNVGDGNAVTGAVLGQQSGASVNVAAAAAVSGPTFTINATSVTATKVAIANTNPLAAGGVEVGRFSLTNGGTVSVDITKIGLNELLNTGGGYSTHTGPADTSTTMTFMSVDDGTVLVTSPPLAFVGGTQQVTLGVGTKLRLTPGQTRIVTLIIAAKGAIGTGDASMLQVDKATTLYDTADGTKTNMSIDTKATLDSVSFK